MTRDFHSVFEDANRGTNPKPTVLISIETGDGGTPWIRLTSTEVDLVFPTAGNTYTARPFEFGEFSVASGDEKSVQLRLADVDGYWDTWLATTQFRWKTIERRRIDRDVLTSSLRMQIDRFRFVSRQRVDREFVMTVEPRLAILSRIRLPGQILTREEFPGIPDAGEIS